MKNSILFVVLFFISAICLSQNGAISGKIIDETTGEELAGAVVQIELLGLGSASDLFGNFEIKQVPAGQHELTISYISYQTKKITGIVVEPYKTATLDIALSSAPVETGVVNIVDFKSTNTEAAVLIEMKEAKGVLSGIGSAQIAKSQDRDASEVARRIPGVTVVDNRFVIVRGLSERYNSVMINNALAPSMESDVKSFSFDIISSGLIDRFLIYKSPSPDLPGEFAGGAVKIFTRNFPNKDFELSFNQSIGNRQGTTGKDFYHSKRSKTDWLGFDNGLRELPSSFPANVRDSQGADRLSVSRSLNNPVGIEKEKAPVDLRSSLYIGKKWSKEYGEFGLVGAINYSRTRTFFTNKSGVYNVYDEILNESDTVSYMYDSTYQTNARVGGLLNFGFRNKHHRIELKTFASQMGQSEDLLRRGIEMEQGNYVQSNFYGYNERLITSSQILGSHNLFDQNGTFEWTFGYSSANSQDPDWRRIRYTKPLDLSNPQYQAYIPFSADPNYFGRLFLNMKESTPMASFSYEHKILKTKEDLKGEDQFLSIKGGMYTENKQRDFSVRNIGYKAASFATFMNYELPYESLDNILDTTNINATNGLLLDEDTKPQDSYSGGNKLMAGYLMFTLPYKRWNLTSGARVEKNSQTLNTKDLQNKEYNIELDSTIVLPSALLSYQFTQKSLIRATYGKTVNRPEFRELAPFAFYDYKRNAIMNGNPNLTFATIDNYDIRWEIYPSASEMFSVGVFYKNFTNPIELYFQPGVGSGGTLSFAPGNAPSATNYGAEIDMRLRLGHITSLFDGSEYDPTKGILNQFTLVANASIIKSEIQLSSKDQETGVNTNRPMMGQSPYIINTGMFYQNDSIGLSVSAMYNVIGERVVVVGVPGIPEVWEMPRHQIDLTISQKIGKHFDIRFGIQDILNQPTRWIQDANNDKKLDKINDQTMQIFKRGSYFNFGVTYNFQKS
jgi:TonB-dependent receptor